MIGMSRVSLVRDLKNLKFGAKIMTLRNRRVRHVSVTHSTISTKIRRQITEKRILLRDIKG